MRNWAPLLLVCGGLATACGEATSLDAAGESPSGPDQGGQTGSLLPGPELPGFELRTAMPCSLASTGDDVNVNEGDVAVVIYPDVEGGSEVRLTDAEGNPVGVELEGLDGSSAKAVRTEQALVEGQYRLEFDCNDGSSSQTQSTTVSVSASAALPATAGGLEARFDPDTARLCSEDPWYAFEWMPSAGLDTYRDLLALSVSINDEAPFVIVDYGQVQFSAQGTFIFSLPRCTTSSERCLPSDRVELSLLVDIAGESMQPSAAKLAFRADCESPPVAESDCAFALTTRRASNDALWLVVLIGVGSGRRLAATFNRSNREPGATA